MKKYLLILAVILATAFTSCTNEDITVDNVIVQINPLTVISPYEEINSGDFSKSEPNWSIIIRTFVYQYEDGMLAAYDEKSITNYATQVTAKFNLNPGKYIIFVASSLRRDTDALDLWLAKDIRNLETLRMVRNSGYTNIFPNILGISCEYADVNETGTRINTDIRLAGAMINTSITNWNRYTDITDFGFKGTNYSDILAQDRDSWYYMTENGTNLLTTWQYNSRYQGMYAYVFLLPSENVNFEWQYKLNDGRWYTFQNGSRKVKIDMGYQYFFEYDVTAGTSKWLKKLQDPNARGSAEPELVPCELKDETETPSKPGEMKALDFITLSGGLQKLK